MRCGVVGGRRCFTTRCEDFLVTENIMQEDNDSIFLPSLN